MNTYTDANKITWTIDVNISAIRRILSMCGCDITKSEVFEAVSRDYIQLANVIWACVSAWASEKGLTEEQFAEGLKGDGFQSAIDAFSDDYIAFFPTPEARELLLASRKVALETTRKAFENATEAVKHIGSELNANEKTPKTPQKSTSSTTALNSQESLVSSPADTPSGPST